MYVYFIALNRLTAFSSLDYFNVAWSIVVLLAVKWCDADEKNEFYIKWNDATAIGSQS